MRFGAYATTPNAPILGHPPSEGERGTWTHCHAQRPRREVRRPAQPPRLVGRARPSRRRGVHDAKVRGDWAASGSKDSLQLWHMPTVLEAKMTKDSQSQAPQVPVMLHLPP